MNPDERHLLERSLKLAEENNELLLKIQARAKRATIYGVIRLILIILPFVIGYLFLQPYLDQAMENYKNIQGLFN